MQRCDPEAPEVDAGRDAGAICARLADCDDGLYCNGAETCAPGDEGAGPDGCVAGTLPCEGDEICNEEEDACERDDCSDGGDADGDGDARPSCGGNDCDDEDGTIHSRGARGL
ncbi:MAG TPA: hypothetical protein RMH99_28830 [Sandaracinaceae bacterium LLY-WYZ-13_1]|nr:hypothetical protein [Sandaracinaceae bacterium LLY-WYZ-13_1]